MNPAAGLNFGLGGAKYMLFVGTVYPVSGLLYSIHTFTWWSLPRKTRRGVCSSAWSVAAAPQFRCFRVTALKDGESEFNWPVNWRLEIILGGF